jgi:hypothetical protein
VYLRRQADEPPLLIAGPAPGVRLNVAFPPGRLERHELPSQLPFWGIPWLNSANWRVWERSLVSPATRWRLSASTLLIDGVFAIFVILAIVAMCEYRRRRRPSLISFKLWEFFVGISFLCAGFGWIAFLEREHQREASIIEREISRSNEDPIGECWFETDQTCVAPTWMRSLVGERFMPKFMWRTGGVQIQRQWRDENRPEIYQDISKLHHVRQVVLENTRDPFHFSNLSDFRRLNTLELWDCQWLDAEDVRELKLFPRLRKLIVEDMDEMPSEIQSLLAEELPNCQVVNYDDDW